MKIRTGFVTNSSSASSINITIDNPILLEILQRYKEMGVFGEAEVQFEIGKVGAGRKTEAFSLDEGTDGGPFLSWRSVISLHEVLGEIIEVMEDDEFVDDPSKYDQELYMQMQGELIKREEEIIGSYLRVVWCAHDWSWGSEAEPGDECGWEFHYDPISGEKLYVEEWDKDGNRQSQ